MDAPEEIDALVIGAGPAGLMAAEMLGAAGHAPVICEAKPSAARKFLMAGKSGLNLTKDEPDAAFLAAYREAAPWLAPMLDAFGPEEVKRWAEGLGVELFTGTTGRVFPREMKASPLLRAWLTRLDGQEAELRRRWRFVGHDKRVFIFETPNGPRAIAPKVCILALGGASWARLGSDGAWAEPLAAAGVPLAPFGPANMGGRLAWSPHMEKHFGAPLKNIALSAGGETSRGECVISRAGLEGGGLYALSRPLRAGAALSVDLCPDVSLDALTARLAKPRGKATLANHLRKAARLDPAKIALLMECARPLPEGAALAARLKALPLPLAGLAPMDQAISTSGGIRAEGLTGALELTALPGVFAAGEMLDWEAPTGGYLLTASMATGRHAGLAAVRRLAGA